MIYRIYKNQDINFKIFLSLFGWKENILPKQHIVDSKGVFQSLKFTISIPLAINLAI